ncbi:MAG: hypothetical protein ACI4UE_04815 [Candidatus Scatovivens sp.]
MKSFGENIKDIFYKLIYIIEFILCLLESKVAFNLLVYKIDIGSWNLKYIIEILLIASFIILLMYFAIKKYNKFIEKMFLLFAIPIGILYMTFLLPTFAPDENYHAYRAYQISEGQIIVKVDENNDTHTYIPEDLLISGIDRWSE